MEYDFYVYMIQSYHIYKAKLPYLAYYIINVDSINCKWSE